MDQITRPLIGEILIQRKKIDSKQLDEALKIQQKEHGFIGEILVKQGYLEELDIVVALVVQCGLPYISVTKCELDPEVIRLIPYEIAKEYRLIALDRIGDVLSVVMTNPLSDELKAKLEKLTCCQIATFISTKTEIDAAIVRSYKKG